MRSARQHDFSRIPAPNVPRSTIDRPFDHLTTLDADYIVPVMWDEILPGDTYNVEQSFFGRINTLLYPLMDSLYLDTFTFFVPYRLLWENWEDFITNEVDTYTVPLIGLTNAITEHSLEHYLGIPMGETEFEVDAWPFRAYNLIYNTWFRPQAIIDEKVVDIDDGTDSIDDYVLLKRAKRHDYFTSCLEEPQAGDAIELPFGTEAPVKGTGAGLGLTDGAENMYLSYDTTFADLDTSVLNKSVGDAIGSSPPASSDKVVGVTQTGSASGMVADLSTSVAPNINSLREAFQLQKMLEKDARGGQRYIESLKIHFGVTSQDMRLQRPEYLCGSSQRLVVKPVPQTSQSDTTPQGTLTGYGFVADNNARYVKSFNEHGLVMTLVNIRSDIRYQQGIDRKFWRQTRYDFYWPTLAHLGEQEVYNREIYFQNDGATNDENVFGYVPRYDEYRYMQSRISGYLSSLSANTLDAWHVAEEFGALPTLVAAFINQNTPIDRVTASGENIPEFIVNAFFKQKCTRCMPCFAIPGLIDHF